MIYLKALLFEETTKSMSDKDFWTLVTICVAETVGYKPLEYAKVAQSIYNRLNCKCGYGSTISEIITAAGQFQPVFRNEKDWNNITDYETACTALWNSKKSEKGWKYKIVKKRIKDCSLDLQNTSYQSAAADFVGSRTEFLAYAPKSKTAKGETTDTGNVWFWNYAGKKKFYDNDNLDATSIPSFPSSVVTDIINTSTDMYIVQDGDTLSSIAAKQPVGITAYTIAIANGIDIKNPIIKPGQELKIE